MAGAEQVKALPTPDEYNDMVAQAELIDIKLIKSDFNVEPGFFALEDEENALRYSCELDVSLDGENTSTLMGFYACEAGVKHSRKWLLKVKATYLVVYYVNGSATEAAKSAFLERVGRFACFPYFRGHVAHLATSAGAELAPLPVLKGNLPRAVRDPQLGGRKKK